MIMINIKKLTIASLALCAPLAQASDFSDFYNRDMLIGCGTIVSVRNVNQSPLMEYEYAAQNGTSIRTGDIAALMSVNGVAGFLTAAIGSVVVDNALQKNAEDVKEQTNWENVKAVRVKMDSGEEINLPLFKPRTGGTDRRQYADGKRVTVYHVPRYKSIQLDAMARPPNPNEQDKARLYQILCKRRLDDATANSALKEAANLVQEDKIIP